MRSEHVGRHADEGFTLIEVLMALTVLTVAMTGLGAFFVNSSLIVAEQRDHRNAAVLAGNALEKVRALEEGALLDGRGQVKVDKQFQDAEAGPFKNRLKPYFDSMKREGVVGTTTGEDAALPTAPKKFTVAGVEFEQSLFVGPCEVYVVLSDDCVQPMALDNPKRPTDTTTILEYFRVVVLVKWTNKGCVTNAGACGHITSTLISRKADEAAFSSKRAWPEIWPPYMRTFYRGLSSVYVKMGARGGNLPNHWSAVGLPDGLTINELTGIIAGTPTKAGTWTYATTGSYIKVIENEPPAGSPSARADREEGYTWTVVEPPTLTLATPPKSHVGDLVNLKPTLAGGVGPFTYSAEPALPAGLTLNADGSITGTASKSYTTTIKVIDYNDVPGTLTFTHNVYEPLTLPVIADQTFPVLSPVSLTALAAGGDGVYKYTATGLPTELTINPTTGVISGAPVLIAGRYLPTVTVTDGLGATATGKFVLDVTTKSGLKFTGPTGDVKTVRNQMTTLAVTTNAAAIGVQGVKVTVVGLLPPGLNMTFNNGRDIISGTPTLPGVYPIVLTATSSNPVETMQFTFIWTVS